MRPVTRGPSPIQGDFDDFHDAKEPLLGRLGFHCSFCERHLDTGLAVEHIQPKSIHPNLEGRWDNFLLACVNCNSTKGTKDPNLQQVYLPDRDNTLAALSYQPNGSVIPTQAGDTKAKALIELVGLDAEVRTAVDDNGRTIANDRKTQRLDAWLKAERYRSRLHQEPSAALEDCIVDLAIQTGFFSIWLSVFSNTNTPLEQRLRRRLIQAHTGTATECFDQNTELVTPRPANALPFSGKV